MKNFLKRSVLPLMLLAMAFLMPPVQTQAQTSLISTNNGTVLDTVTNTGVRIMATKFTGFRETITAVILITKLTGTQGGTMVPVGSNDGVTYSDISQISKDTVTVGTGATVTKAYSFARGYQWYGVQWTGTGTMASTIQGKAIARKQTD